MQGESTLIGSKVDTSMNTHYGANGAPRTRTTEVVDRTSPPEAPFGKKEDPTELKQQEQLQQEASATVDRIQGAVDSQALTPGEGLQAVANGLTNSDAPNDLLETFSGNDTNAGLRSPDEMVVQGTAMDQAFLNAQNEDSGPDTPLNSPAKDASPSDHQDPIVSQPVRDSLTDQQKLDIVRTQGVTEKSWEEVGGLVSPSVKSQEGVDPKILAAEASASLQKMREAEQRTADLEAESLKRITESQSMTWQERELVAKRIRDRVQAIRNARKGIQSADNQNSPAQTEQKKGETVITPEEQDRLEKRRLQMIAEGKRWQAEEKAGQQTPHLLGGTRYGERGDELLKEDVNRKPPENPAPQTDSTKANSEVGKPAEGAESARTSPSASGSEGQSPQPGNGAQEQTNVPEIPETFANESYDVKLQAKIAELRGSSPIELSHAQYYDRARQLLASEGIVPPQVSQPEKPEKSVSVASSNEIEAFRQGLRESTMLTDEDIEQEVQTRFGEIPQQSDQTPSGASTESAQGGTEESTESPAVTESPIEQATTALKSLAASEMFEKFPANIQKDITTALAAMEKSDGGSETEKLDKNSPLYLIIAALIGAIVAVGAIGGGTAKSAVKS